MADQPIRVFVIDDHSLLRSGLKLLLNSQPDFEFVGDAADGDSALHALAATAADVVTLDLGLHGASGLELIAGLRKVSQARILIVTMYDDAPYMRAALALGAHGYLLKSEAESMLLHAIRELAEGRQYVSPQLWDAEASSKPSTRTDPAIDSLSARESSVLVMIAEGHTNQVVADRLGVGVKSIESYRARIMSKLKLQTRADLVRVAIESGMLKPAAPVDGSPRL